MSYSPIAVIGMACCFPAAHDPEIFWRNLKQGICAIGPCFPEHMEEDRDGVDPTLWLRENYLSAGTRVKNASHFDYAFFNYSAHEATLIDPQQRLFLQACVQALEHGNYPHALLPKWQLTHVGVFGSTRQSSYARYLPAVQDEEITRAATLLHLLGNDKDYLATRVAYKLGLTGPAMTIQTACSSSLVAAHYACRSLQLGECDMALAGGVGISFPQGLGYIRQEGSIFALDGQCRPFGDGASGIVTGNGLGVALLKRLDDAQRDGDVIHAVILGSAIGNDGADKVGYTAPSRAGQQDVVRAAMEASGVRARDIGMVEAHGTGTTIGDPIEIEALTSVYRETTADRQYCGIGSIKGNLGHLETAAGIASLLKAVLSVRDGIRPATLGATPPNPLLQLADSPFHLLHDTAPWPNTGTPRIAAVSSFGIGGTNCHMIVGQPPATTRAPAIDRAHTLLLQSHSRETLEALRQPMAECLSEDCIGAAARTALLRRPAERWRIAVCGRDSEQLRERLAQAPITLVPEEPRALWLFSGQGSQVAGMGKTLHRHCPAFRAALDACAASFARHGVADLRAVMFDDARHADLARTDMTQPALFAFHYALAQQLLDWGHRPRAVIGHSIGEFAAAVIAGQLRLEDAVRLVAQRGRLMQDACGPGAMLAVQMSEDEFATQATHWPTLSVAAVNHPARLTLSGPTADIDAFAEAFASRCHRLSVQRAFHSEMMTPLREAFIEQAHHAAPGEPDTGIVFISACTGEAMAHGTLDTGYWWRQLRETVHFAKALRHAAEQRPNLIWDMGPDGSFARLARQQDVFDESTVYLGLSPGEQAYASLLAQLARSGLDTPLRDDYAALPVPWCNLPARSFRATPVWPARQPALPPALQRIHWRIQPSLLTQLRDTGQEVALNLALLGDEQGLWRQRLGDTPHHVRQIDRHTTLPPLDGIDLLLDLRPLDMTIDGADAFDALARDTLPVLQAALAQPRLALISVLPDSQSAQGWSLAALHSLFQAACNEDGSRRFLCMETSGSTEDADTLCRLLPHLTGSGPSLALHDGRLHEPVAESIDAGTLTALRHTPEDCALIAGFGALGQALAEHLFARGVTRFALVMRHSPGPVQEAAIQSLRQRGTDLALLTLDMCDTDALREALARHALRPTLVYHTAHAGSDSGIHDARPEALLETLRTKTHGSLALYRAVADQPLRQFCLFGSLVSWMNGPQSAAYAAANRWQEHFGAHLAAQGVPASTLVWGPWALGMANDASVAERIRAGGLLPLPGDTLLHLLDHTGHHGLMAYAAQTSAFARSIRALAGAMPVFAKVLGPASATPATHVPATPLADASPDARRSLIEQTLTGIVAGFFNAQAPEPHTDFHALGLDSLLLMDLTHQVRERLALTVSVRDAFQHNSIARLTDFLLAQSVPEPAPKADIAFGSNNARGPSLSHDHENRHQPFPLTDLQQAFWIGRNSTLELGSVACHQYIEIELDALDVDRLEQAWNQLIQRHDMMRCVMLPSAQQQILDTVPYYRVAVDDLRERPEEQRQAHLDAVRERMSYQVLDASRWPLFELRVSQLPNGISRIHLDMDLLVFDVQSFRIIYGELDQLLKQPDTTLPPLEIAFRDCVLAEQARRQTPEYDQARRFWQERITTLPAAPSLPLRRDAGTLTRPTFRTLDHRLPPLLWQNLQREAARQGLTPSAVLLTAFTRALAQWCGAPDFTLNITYFNRQNLHPQIMSICGDFTSLMLLPVDARAGERFLDAAKRTQDSLWDALAHREYSGIQVMRELGRARAGGADRISMPVVFTSMIGMDFDDPTQPDWALMSRQVFQINQTPQVWLDYQATEYGGALANRWFIVDDLFEPTLIEGLFAAYTGELERLARDTDAWRRPPSDARPERDRKLLERINANTVARPETCLHALFLRQAEITPQATALMTTEGHWDYRSLAEITERIARRLPPRRDGACSPVAVLLPKGADAVIAALAIMRAGLVYTPVNPDYDDPRLARVLDSLDPVAVLCPDVAHERMRALTRAPLLSMRQLREAAPTGTGTLPNVRPEEPAYIIFTSGSTGTPKGVVLDHRCPVNTLLSMNETFGIDAGHRALSLCALYHDMSVYDLFGMLACGGALVMPDASRQHDTAHWLALIAEHQVSLINSVPALVQLLVDSAEKLPTASRACASLRKVLLGGDWIALTLPARLRALSAEIDIFSIGGPTETAVVSSYYAIGEIDPHWRSIPYGRPLPNQTLQLRNRIGQPVPVGVPGEIHMGGMAMSLGYLNDPERTSERYLDDNGPLFRTGDLAVLGADGEMTLLGRIDDQLNINGVRIEPGEIESTLVRHDAVAQAVVVAAGEPPRLNAFIATTEHAPVRQLRIEAATCDRQWQDTLSHLAQTGADIPAGFSPEDYRRHYQDMEDLSTLVMRRALHESGLFDRAGDRARLDTLSATLGVSQRHQKILRGWIRTLCGDGLFRLHGEALECLTPFDADKYQRLRARLDQQAHRGEPHAQRFWALYQGCIDRLDALLQGRFNPLDLMFEQGRTDFVESWYSDNPVSRHFNRIAADTLSAWLDGLPSSTPLRILEFGAGIGSATAGLLPRLPAGRCRYLYTDLSDYFFEHARQKFAGYSFVEFRHYDINEDPGLSGLEDGDFDLIIGANVLHDAQDVNHSSRLLRRLLKPGGLLALIEGTSNPRFQMVSLGFVEGLTEYRDQRLESHLPMLSAHDWHAVLKRAGFERSGQYPDAVHWAECMHYHLILAQNPAHLSIPDLAPISRWASEELSPQLLPRKMIRIEQLPLSPNGKVDRHRLQRSLSQHQPEPTSAPATDPALHDDTQRALARLWQQALNRHIDDAQANFFLLGGDSLLMTRVSALIHEHFGVSPSLGQLLRMPVLHEQARWIDQQHAQRETPGELELEEGFL
ncbi:amino acid adenylation domain-containing protein [Lysobacter pythonis]|uniref:Amino acid adenylation domain-containing protein n=1 Tax=Solilutibacter pythonis TaxID=2483112 RepID=A0A3M2I1U7_9GAMM|nr:non-ribosomal peptide synthetase/type I polyketide synthase [Lysobacter pythonis]RMH93589.1 amino acid adenylation domain-containing protein [Lysobacter pythonis]